MSQSAEGQRDSQVSVLLGGLLIILFGLTADLTAIDMGWASATVLGLVLLLIAWRVQLSPQASMLRFLMVGAGLVALLGALFVLVT